MQTILLIDDSVIQRTANQHLLANAGYRVIGIGDGQKALRTASDSRPDLILLDMILPGLSGPEVLKSLKRHPATAEIPVIVLSSIPRANEAKLLREGAAAFFEKGSLASPQPLLSAIERILEPAN